MEIEAKFALPNLGTFQRLQAAEHIAGFALSAHQIQQVRDTYLDTPGRLLLDAGYVCRCRELEARVLVTIKGLRQAEGAVHRREEIEISLPSYRPPAEWPESPVRDLVLDLIGEAPLIPLFELHQTRVFRRMSQGELLVAELSLDKVRLMAGERSQTYLELEVELAPQGTEEDMAFIVAYLQEECGLKPRHRSKFDRAMTFLDQASSEDLMTPKEHAVCREIAKRDDLYGRRAQGLLALEDGATQAEAAERVGRSARTVRRWLADFVEDRLATFPNRVLKDAGVRTVSDATPWSDSIKVGLPPEEEDLVPSPQPAVIPASRETQAPSSSQIQAESDSQPALRPAAESLDALFDRYQVDRAHARAVADHALSLYDHLGRFHGLPAERRSLLETAALVHNIGLSSDPDRHHTVGRDILLSHPPEGLDAQARLIVALTTFLHRKRMTPKKVEKKVSKRAFADLTGEAREEALALAALVRLADGLDYSQTGTSKISDVRIEGNRAEFEVLGPYAGVDARRAEEKSDLWDLLFDVQVHFAIAEPKGVEITVPPGEKGPPLEEPVEEPVELMRDPTVASASKELAERPGLTIEDTMADAARKTLVFHFQRMLYHEPGTRLGVDIEELHDMRVATRRMRSAFQVFEGYLDMGRLKPILKGLRRTGSHLGAVRDLDVFWEKTERYLDALPPDRRDDLVPLQQAWGAERERMRERMLAYLDGRRYVEFRESFAEILQTSEAWGPPPLTQKGEAVPYALRHVVPMVVYERVADVLAYDEWVTRTDVALEQLHRLRIAAKRLRYTLEFFEEVLAPQNQGLIKEMKKLQDHLGDLQDAVVASELLRDFLTWGTWGHAEGKKQAALPDEPIVAPGVATYMAHKQRELQHLLSTFSDVWGYFQSRAFKRTVGEVVAPL